MKSRIRALEKKGIICGYKLGLNVSKMGYLSFRVDLELNSTAQNKRLFEFCKQHKSIYQINKTIGGPNFELEVVVKNTEQLFQIVEEIKNNFGDVVDDVDYFQFSAHNILKYIPD